MTNQPTKKHHADSPSDFAKKVQADRELGYETRPRAQWRHYLYVVIFEANTRAGQLFDIGLLLAILLSVVVVSLETVESVYAEWSQQLLWIEWGLTLLFTMEYVARLVTVRKPMKYALSFFGIVDLLAFSPMYLALLIGWETTSMSVVRSIRLLRVFRVFKMVRMLREARELRGAIVRAREKIFVFMAVVLIAVTISGTIMYQLEKDREGSLFISIPESMYWAIITMTTVGYGDIVPHTVLGKVVSSILILLGYSLIIVPTGFVSAEIRALKERGAATPRTCPECLREGHASDATYCDHCGAMLEPS